MVHEILPVGMLQCNCSIFGDEETHQGMVIDPGDNIPAILKLLEKHGLCLNTIVITHAHLDHIGGAQKLRAATGAPIYMDQKDEELARHLDAQAAWLGMPDPGKVEIDSNLRDGDTLNLGAGRFEVLHTPGHTQGSISLWIPEESKVVAGDTLFRDSIGRTDLPGGDGRRILRSIQDKLLTLPEETLVIPGHGDITSIGREKRYNYFLQNL